MTVSDVYEAAGQTGLREAEPTGAYRTTALRAGDLTTDSMAGLLAYGAVADLLSKLNHRDQTIALLNVPEEMSADIETLLAGAETTSTLPESVDFALVFVRTLDEVRQHGTAVLSRAKGDAIVWFCYPKQTSRRYTCEFNRDNGWQVLADHRFEPVRQVALDDDWSALRFRNIDYIKKMTRNPARRRTSR